MKNIRPMLRHEFLQEYDHKIGVLHGELHALNTYSHLLTKIADFPWRVLGDVETPFWACVSRSFYESCVSVLFRVVIDQDPRALALKRLRSQIIENFKDPADSSQLKAELGRVRFEKGFREIEGLVSTERRHRIAHLDTDHHVPWTEIDTTTRQSLLKKLGAAVELVNEFFDVLNAERRGSKLPAQYEGRGTLFDGSSQVDVELLLETVARNSRLLNMTEKQPSVWPSFREMDLTDEEVQVLNEWRTKFNLPNIE